MVNSCIILLFIKNELNKYTIFYVFSIFIYNKTLGVEMNWRQNKQRRNKHIHYSVN